MSDVNTQKIEQEQMDKIINEIRSKNFRSDKEKLVYLTKWFVSNFNYDYAVLKAYHKNAAMTMLGKKYLPIDMVRFVPGGWIDEYERHEGEFSEKAERDWYKETYERHKKFQQENPEIVEEYKNLYNLRQKYLQLQANGGFYKSKSGVCADFASAFKELCKELNIGCIEVFGNIMSEDVYAGHEWNAVEIDGEVKMIDLSFAIHNRDEGKDPEEYLFLTEYELMEKDKDKNRTIREQSVQELKEFRAKCKAKSEQ